MAYAGSGVDNADVLALLREEFAPQIITGALDESAVLPLSRRLPDFSKYKEKMAVLNELVTAYFPDAANDLPGAITTSTAAWQNVYLYAEKIAAIVPIPKDAIEDSDYPIEDSLIPAIKEAMGYAIDCAIIHGTGKPTNWPTALYTTINTAGQVVSEAGFTDLYDALYKSTGCYGLVEADGYAVSGALVMPSMQSEFRECRAANGTSIFIPTPAEKIKYSVNGVPLNVDTRGAVGSANSLLGLFGDFKQLVYAIRKDMAFEVLKEATLVVGGDTINLAQRDMIALKCTGRLGWALPNPVNRLQAVAANRCPFSALTA